MRERKEFSSKPKITEVKGREVERKVELDEGTEKKIKEHLNYQEEKVNELLLETKVRRKLSYEDQLRLENLFRSPLEKAFKQLEEKTPGDELIRLLELAGREEEKLGRVSDMYPMWEQVGLIPPEDAKEGQTFFEAEKAFQNKEGKELLRILTERKKEG